MGFHGKVSGENLEISQPIIVPHRTDAVEIVKGQWPQRNFNAFFSSVSLPWEVLPTVPTTVIVPTVSPVEIMSAETVVSVRTTTNVDGARNAVIANAVVRLLAVPARTTTNVNRARNAVIANAVVVRLLVPVRPTTSVTVESIAVEEFVRRTVVGAAGLLQALLSARLFFCNHHFHRILLLLRLLPVLPLSYTRCCGRRRPTATATNLLNPNDDDATSTCSSAGELQPAFSRWIRSASSSRLQPASYSWLRSTSSRFQSGYSALLRRSTTTKPICSTSGTSSSGVDASCCKRRTTERDEIKVICMVTSPTHYCSGEINNLWFIFFIYMYINVVKLLNVISLIFL